MLELVSEKSLLNVRSNEYVPAPPESMSVPSNRIEQYEFHVITIICFLFVSQQIMGYDDVIIIVPEFYRRFYEGQTNTINL